MERRSRFAVGICIAYGEYKEAGSVSNAMTKRLRESWAPARSAASNLNMPARQEAWIPGRSGVKV